MSNTNNSVEIVRNANGLYFKHDGGVFDRVICLSGIIAQLSEDHSKYSEEEKERLLTGAESDLISLSYVLAGKKFDNDGNPFIQ